MADEYYDIPINGTPQSPRVVEVDGDKIADIILQMTRAKPLQAAAAANAIVDYLVKVYSDSRSVS